MDQEILVLHQEHSDLRLGPDTYWPKLVSGPGTIRPNLGTLDPDLDPEQVLWGRTTDS